MRKILLYLFLLSVPGISFTTYRPNPEFDGLYYYKIDEENSAVIRFYDDGVVIVSSSVNDYAKVMTWFNRDKENFSRVLTGKYKTGKNGSLHFHVKGETGEQKFTGYILADKTLQLHVTDPKAGTSTDRIYQFWKQK